MSTKLPQEPQLNTRSYIARGDITQYTFVKDNATDDESVVAADAGAATVGIYQAYGALESGDPAPITIAGQARLKAGTGGWSKGAYLKSDASGQGIPVTANLDEYGAVAIEDAAAGEVGVVLVQKGTYASA
jgi:hypothetical protein